MSTLLEASAHPSDASLPQFRSVVRKPSYRRLLPFPRRILATLVVTSVVSWVVLVYSNPNSLHQVRVVSAEDWEAPPDRFGIAIVSGLPVDYRLPRSTLDPRTVVQLREHADRFTTSADRMSVGVAFVRRHLNGVERQFSHPVDFRAQTLVDEGLHLSNLCSDYALLFNEVLQSLGETSRVVWLEGHVVGEYFDRQFQKWVFVDPQQNVWSRQGDAAPLSVSEMIHRAERDEVLPFAPIVHDPDPVAAHSLQFDSSPAGFRWYRNLFLNGECSALSGTTLQFPSRWDHLLRFGSRPLRLVRQSPFDTSHTQAAEPLAVHRFLVVTALLLIAFLAVQHWIR